MQNFPILNAKLSDICIGTSAAPTLFPAHFFTNTDDQGNTREFNLSDGFFAAMSPVRNYLFYSCLEDVIQLVTISTECNADSYCTKRIDKGRDGKKTKGKGCTAELYQCPRGIIRVWIGQEGSGVQCRKRKPIQYDAMDSSTSKWKSTYDRDAH